MSRKASWYGGSACSTNMVEMRRLCLFDGSGRQKVFWQVFRKVCQYICMLIRPDIR